MGKRIFPMHLPRTNNIQISKLKSLKIRRPIQWRYRSGTMQCWQKSDILKEKRNGYNHVYIEEIPTNKFQTCITLLEFMLNN